MKKIKNLPIKLSYIILLSIVFFISISYFHKLKSWDIDDEYTVFASLSPSTEYLYQYTTYNIMNAKSVAENFSNMVSIGSYNFKSTRSWLLEDTSPPLNYWIFNIVQNIFLPNNAIKLKDVATRIENIGFYTNVVEHFITIALLFLLIITLTKNFFAAITVASFTMFDLTLISNIISIRMYVLNAFSIVLLLWAWYLFLKKPKPILAIIFMVISIFLGYITQFGFILFSIIIAMVSSVYIYTINGYKIKPSIKIIFKPFIAYVVGYSFGIITIPSLIFYLIRGDGATGRPLKIFLMAVIPILFLVIALIYKYKSNIKKIITAIITKDLNKDTITIIFITAILSLFLYGLLSGFNGGRYSTAGRVTIYVGIAFIFIYKTKYIKYIPILLFVLILTNFIAFYHILNRRIESWNPETIKMANYVVMGLPQQPRFLIYEFMKYNPNIIVLNKTKENEVKISNCKELYFSNHNHWVGSKLYYCTNKIKL